MYMDIAIPDDCFELAPKLRQLDKYELAVTGRDPLWSLFIRFVQTDLIHHTFCFYDKNHNVVAMFGCCPYYKTPEKAAAWWLSTDEPFKSWHYLKNQKEHLNM